MMNGMSLLPTPQRLKAWEAQWNRIRDKRDGLLRAWGCDSDAVADLDGQVTVLAFRLPAGCP